MSTLLNDQFEQCKGYFFRELSTKYVDINEGATAYMTKVPVKDLNIVNIKNITCPVKDLITKSKQFYYPENIPFVVCIPATVCSEEVKHELKNSGMRLVEKTAAMTLNLPDNTFNYDTNSSDDTTIQANDSKLNEWIIPLIASYQSRYKTIAQYAAIHENALKNGIQLFHFSLYKSGNPISSMTLSIHNQHAWIDDVNTLPEFQHKGYGTRLMHYAFEKAKKLGATRCFLESSDSGLPMYLKLGFTLLFKNHIYSNFL